MLVELEKGDFGRVSALFDRFDYHRGHFGSVIVGANPGRVFVDDPHHPIGAVIWPNDGFQYLACDGYIDRFIIDCHELLAASKAPCLELLLNQSDLEARVADLFGELSYFPVQRLLYRLPVTTFSHEIGPPPAARIEPGLSLSVRCESSALEVALSLDGSRIGRCSAWIFGRDAEIDVSIEESHRGRGLGTLICAEFLGLCRQEGIIPWWSCWEDKVESRRLAERLGFELKRAFTVYIHDKEA